VYVHACARAHPQQYFPSSLLLKSRMSEINYSFAKIGIPSRSCVKNLSMSEDEAFPSRNIVLLPLSVSCSDISAEKLKKPFN